MSVCGDSPKITIDGITLDAPDLTLNNVRGGVDIDPSTNPVTMYAPGVGQFTDDPHTTTEVPSDGLRAWPPPAQSAADREAAEAITRRPAIPADPIEDVRLPNGIKYGTQVSQFLTLGDLSARALFANHLKANAGFSVEGIATNLKALSTRLIDPIINQFGLPGTPGQYIINSGFRPKAGRSLHNRGRAADLQWPGQGEAFHMSVAKFVQDSGLAFDQLLVEKGNQWWVHVGYSLEGNTFLTGINTNALSRSTWRYNVRF